MQEKVSMSKYFNNMETNRDVMLLLKEIHTIGIQIETNTSLYDALDEATSMYYIYFQEKGETPST